MDEPIERSYADPPDIMNDPEFAPPQRRDTASSKYGSEIGGETCRICRSEGSIEEPLFYPCKCSGSIKFVHQECLMEWLSHSHKKHCELCKTPFRFTKLYDANMPRTLPWTVFARRACIHAVTLCVKALRALLVGLVWLVLIPFAVRWSWRWMFWMADAGWEREPFIREMEARYIALQAQAENNQTGVASMISKTIHSTWHQIWKAQADKSLDQSTHILKQTLSFSLSNDTANATSIWASQHDTSILSSWTYLSQTTSNEHINRWILDVFEGQLITCVVITGFILIFLIREWVVQQQPLVNLDVPNAPGERDGPVQRAERIRQQTELLQEAVARLHALEEQAQEATEEAEAEFIGWEQLEIEIDRATSHLRVAGEAGSSAFKEAASNVLREVRAAEGSGVSISELSEKMYQKLATLTAEERVEWEEMVVSELTHVNEQEAVVSTQDDVEADLNVAEGHAYTRPTMPARDASFRAMQVQRMLADAGGSISSPSLHDGNVAPSALTSNPPPEPSAQGGGLPSPLTDDSWQHVEHVENQDIEVDHVDIFPDNNDEMPITNAGPDAKINIKRTGNSKARTVVPEPKEESAAIDKVHTDEELTKILDQPGMSVRSASVVSSDALPHPAPQTTESCCECLPRRVWP
jgi:E3 ubiquitin-protein ligase MARCH6